MDFLHGENDDMQNLLCKYFIHVRKFTRKKTMGKTDAIFKDIGVIKRTTTTTTTNYTNDLKKYATSFDLFEGVSNITESLNILHKKIGAPTLNIEQSTKQGNLIDRKITNDVKIF